MPTFDIVSKIDSHELANGVDQANRELQNRFDFKNSKACYELVENKVTLIAPNEFQIEQMKDILQSKLIKRGIDIRCLKYQNIQISLHEARQPTEIRQGIDTDTAKQVVKFIKNSKLKVQASIQGDQVRITGKQRDDLQSAISALKQESFELPFQFENFRD
jgi:cyclic-di-GMP-binding protein